MYQINNYKTLNKKLETNNYKSNTKFKPFHTSKKMGGITSKT